MDDIFPKECTVFEDPRGHVWRKCKPNGMANYCCDKCGLWASTHDNKLLYDDKWRDTTCEETAVILIMKS